jgi:DNA-binding CsgD family transcriptional regulator
VALTAPLLDTLQRMGCGGLVLDPRGEVLGANEHARKMLHNEFASAQSCSPVSRLTLKALLAKGQTRFRMNADTWVLVPREGKRDLVLHAVEVGNGTEIGPQTVLVLIDLDRSPQPSVATLQNMFSLTPSEARLALRIGAGETPSEIAENGTASLATVRSQLASIFAKTQTRRQAELVALLARVAILP